MWGALLIIIIATMVLVTALAVWAQSQDRENQRRWAEKELQRRKRDGRSRWNSR